MGQVPQGYDGLIGRPAPEFNLETVSGARKSLADARQHKKSVLFFWATWCPHCHEELARLHDNLAQLKEKGLNVVLIDLGETREEVAAYLKRNDLELDSFLDENQDLQEKYEIRGVPTLYYVDDAGIIRSSSHELSF
jgi:peroxiredoxin